MKNRDNVGRMRMRGLSICLLAGLVTACGPDHTGRAMEPVISVPPQQRAALETRIRRHLEADKELGVLAAERPDLRPRVFCQVEVIEVRQARGHQLAGVVAGCEELARSGAGLVSGSGHSGPLLITVDSSVREVRRPGDGSEYVTSIRDMFSPEGAPEVIERSDGHLVDQARQRAREEFGLPDGAPVTPASLG